MDKDFIFRHALKNAVEHGGKASEGAVLGRVLGEKPELRQKVDAVKKEIEKIVKEVNLLSLEKQKKLLGGEKEPEKKLQEPRLPDLPNAKKGKVVTRFAPAPTGPLHILHILRAVMISYLFAKKYQGKFVLRLEDTDPRKVEKEFYEMIREDLKSLDVEWDGEYLQSDYMDLYYQKAEVLLRKGDAYICLCNSEAFQKLKEEKRNCPCRRKNAGGYGKSWEGMLNGSMREGDAVLRLRTSMQDPNPAMRDPALFRIVDADHPLMGDKYKVWPLYNFANVVMDDLGGITHVFRGKEHEHNTAIQERIYRSLGISPPFVINFGMMYLPEEKLHKRDIRKGIAEGLYTGWDDLRLPTVRAFLRKGFLPQSFKEFSLLCGLSKTDIRIDLANLEAINRKLIDPLANRYMVVTDPVEIDVTEILKTGTRDFVLMKNHPEREDTRKVAVTGRVFVSGEDFRRFKGKEIRLIDLFNVKLDKKPSLSKSQKFDMKTPKIQWVSGKNIPVKILYPGKEIAGAGEEALKNVKPGTIIQILRMGFGKVEKPGTIVFGHK